MKTVCMVLAVILCVICLQALAGSGGPFAFCFVTGSVPTETGRSAPPEGPEGADPAEEIPVWQFRHMLSPEGLDTAVIQCFTVDCEEGLIPAETTEEELERVRDLAVHGVVTGKHDDTMVTGGTWVYTFETPDGQFLMSLEFYKGLLVGPDGMYNYKR